MKKILLIATAGLLSFATANAQKGRAYGENILRFYPVNAFVYGDVGIGFAYERILSKDGKFGVKIPVHLGVNNGYQNYYNSYYTGVNANITNVSFMLNPGIKFYPAGQRRASYSLGTSLFTSFGTNDSYDWNNSGSFYTIKDRTYFKSGILIENAVQFNITPKFNFGLEFSVGPSYINHVNQDGIGLNQGIDFMVLGGFHIGYRF